MAQMHLATQRAVPPLVELLDQRYSGFWKIYLERGLFLQDATVERLRNASGVLTWSRSRVRRGLASHPRPLAMAFADNNLCDGLFVPVRVQDQARDVHVLLSERSEIDKCDQYPLAVIAALAVDRIAELSSGSSSETTQLTRREMEVCEWMAHGKSDWEIGQILDISEKTVNSHAQRIKRKYGVATRVQAILLAAKAGALRL